ncbi:MULTISPECIES: TonB-dependent siderophore receptor [Pseudoalteromonas]|jgi:iron complex outermembrane receptor protein|uniref:TonB-dependent receptor n=1 Tax=Pseudoalteromonas tetraodonis TaxID=43659 RepID=A0ABD4ELZ4_9GAMM|nr:MULTISPECIES: TonB-dependent siderophore receptor [Pseudoalteromonas]KYL34861.1 TonB-dependent receptor [Pseudoalteromonas spiralis]MDN3395442.1 TonB-dependent siderophore receptor [Pseudoalteromonas sp. APC 3215]MDN3405683.1 TonB-dependent siderophore receptor [Pseudoalteromonas sp. APC 3218]MDN3410276.1 TonB-dependent siderophore receptor [Pseudoalteromonas sp. APC 3894]MDN3417469.1 TonB-dependent siderophore receptor [Pseudoalteromonas sp. APC 3227]
MKYSLIYLACLSASAQSLAQSQPIEKIAVTYKQAYRGDIPQKQMPQSIETLDNAILDQKGITQLQDALDFSASISRKNNSGALWDSFSIRGLSGNENMPSGYLINGFSGGRGFSGPRDVSNIEYIEVLKGPGSALYGRSEPGGTVNIVTKKPQFEQQGELKLSLGSDNFNRVEGDYTNGINDNTAFRINGAWQDSDSYRDEVYTHKKVITPSIYHQINASTSITYEFEYVDLAQLFDRGVVVLNDNFNTVPSSRYLGNPNDGDTQVYSRGHQVTLNHDINNEWSLVVGANYRSSTLTGFSSDAELAPSRQSLFDDGRTLTRQQRYRDYEVDDTSLKFELSGHFDTAGITHHLLMGADAYKYDLRTGLYRYRGGNGTYTIDIYQPNYNVARPEVGLLYENNEQQDAYGIYVQDQMDLTDKFKLLVGLRFDSVDQDILETKSAVLSSSSQSQVSPRIGLVYELNNAVTLYSSYSEGFLPLSGTDASGDPFGFEYSDSIEVGAKFSYQGIAGTLALFDATKSNMLVADPVNVGFSAPIGKANSKGVELDLSTYITDDTKFNLSYAYIDASTANDIINADWGVPIKKGSPLVNVPKNNLNLTLSHQTVVLGKELELGASYQYTSERLGDAADLTFNLPSYQLVGIFGQVNLTERTKLNISVNNIFDEEYAQSSYNALWVYPGAPTQFKMSLAYQF